MNHVAHLCLVCVCSFSDGDLCISIGRDPEFTTSKSSASVDVLLFCSLFVQFLSSSITIFDRYPDVMTLKRTVCSILDHARDANDVYDQTLRAHRRMYLFITREVNYRFQRCRLESSANHIRLSVQD